MARAKKAADPSAPKTTRSRKQVATMPESAPVAVVETTKTVTVDANGNVEETIRQRAYEIYKQREGNGGSPEEDWFRAEAEILGRSA